MGNKNARIRAHLAATGRERISQNCFHFGAVQVKIGPDSPIKGVEFEETIKFSVYNPVTDTDMVLVAKVENVDFIENALGEI